MLPTAILAGGLATRLRPITQTIPKALVEVAGEPFLFHQLRLLQANGIERVVVCVGYLGELVVAALEAWRDPRLSVQMSFDGPRLLGTAGALKHARALLGEAFFVLYGDSYLRCDFRCVQAAFRQNGKAGLMTVYRNADRWERSNVELDAAGRILRYDKRARSPRMQHVDYGLGVLSSRALELVPDEEPYDLAVLYQQLLERDQLAAVEVSERFYEIGSFDGLEATRQLLSAEKARA
jgi:NDP-sugar pyrophosphorylase family protein